MLSALVVGAMLVPLADPPAEYVIRGATVHDGAGKPGYRADVLIGGERIIAIRTENAPLAGKPRIIDGTGLVVAPGFIDLHTHSDTPITEKATRANLNYLMQGVTTIVTGNCGAGPVDVAAFFKKIDEGKAGSNVIHQMPHNAIRQQVMGNVNRPPTPDELEKMKALVGQGMKDGAWGLSTGLIYTPGTYAETAEIIELARVAAKHGGFYASHMRHEDAGLLSAVHETLEIGRQAKLPVHISHFKASTPKAWGKAADAIALIQEARAKGQVVTADQYPYPASSTSLTATVIPTRFREGSQKDLVARFDDAEQGPKLRKAIENELADRAGGKALRIARYTKNRQWQGKDLTAIAAQEGKSVLDLVIEIERNGGAQIVHFSMNEEEVRLIMKQPFVATASDGSAQVPAETVPHPRSYGCFARKIGRYAVEEKLLSLEHAIRSASGLPADILKLPERGYLKPGYFADVVVFDPQTFRDTATYDKPHQYATGVRYLFVNGVLTIDEGKYTDAYAGKALRHPQPVAHGGPGAHFVPASAGALASPHVADTQLSPQQKESAARSEREALLKKLATPREHHQRLDALAGKWKLAVKWRDTPDGKWTESNGTAEYKWILGKRFLLEEFKYDMGGQPLEWLGIYGYDNYRKKYTAAWVDNMGTNTEYAEGDYDPKGKVLTYTGEQDDPATGGKRKFKWIITIENQDKLRFDSYDQDPPGKYFKNTEVVATRLREAK